MFFIQDTNAQSAMTGESLPVEKFVQSKQAGDAAEPSSGLLAQRNLVFMGTNVVSGTAQALVVATGGRSYFGTLRPMPQPPRPRPTLFRRG